MINYYVSPNGTGNGLSIETPTNLTNVKAMVRAVAGTDNVTVWRHGGRYALTETLVFNELDSGTNGYKNIWRDLPGEFSIISGGHSVTGWSPVLGKTWMYQASVPANSQFRRMSVNGEATFRSRMSGSDFLGGDFIFQDEATKRAGYMYAGTFNLNSITNQAEIEFHFSPNRWNNGFIRGGGGVTTHPRFGDPVLLFFTEPDADGHVGWDYWDQVPAAVNWVENAFEFLNASTKGQFYLNRTTDLLYYVPRDGENMETAEVIVPMLEHVVKFENCDNVIFVGGSLRDTDWLSVNQHKYLTDAQDMDFVDWVKMDWTLDVWLNSPATKSGIEIINSTIQIIQPEVSHHGGPGIGLQKGAVNCQIQGGLISQCGGNGVRNRDFSGYYVYDVFNESGPTLDKWRYFLESNDDRNKENKIKCNKITRIGQYWRSAAGIFNGASEGTEIDNNRIFNIPYTGISARGNPGMLVFPYNIKIRKNLVYDTMLGAADGGGIYSQGGIYGLLVEENYLYNIGDKGTSGTAVGTGHWPLYSDDYGMGSTWRKNVVEKNPLNGPLEWTLYKSNRTTTSSNLPWYTNPPYPETNQTYPNRVNDNFYEGGMSAGRLIEHDYDFFANNTSFQKSARPVEVQRIIAEAGLQTLMATEIIDGEVIVYGWRNSTEETITVTASSGTVQDYEEPLDLMWRARVVGITEEGLTVYANGKSLKVGQALAKNPIFRGDGSRAGNILKGDGSKGGIVMKNNGGTWSPN